MGDTLSHIYDLYEDYKILCKEKQVKPIDIENSDWYEHFNKLKTNNYA